MSRSVYFALTGLAVVGLVAGGRFLVDQKNLAARVADSQRRARLKAALDRLPLAQDVEWSRPVGQLPLCLYYCDQQRGILRQSLDGRIKETVVDAPNRLLSISAEPDPWRPMGSFLLTSRGVPSGRFSSTVLDESEDRHTTAAFYEPNGRWGQAKAPIEVGTQFVSPWTYAYRPTIEDDGDLRYRFAASITFMRPSVPPVTHEFARSSPHGGLVAVTSKGFALIRDGDSIVLMNLNTGQKALLVASHSAEVWPRDLHAPDRYRPVCTVGKGPGGPIGSNQTWFVWTMKNARDYEIRPDVKPTPYYHGLVRTVFSQ